MPILATGRNAVALAAPADARDEGFKQKQFTTTGLRLPSQSHPVRDLAFSERRGSSHARLQEEQSRRMASGLPLQKIARHDLIFEKYVDVRKGYSRRCRRRPFAGARDRIPSDLASAPCVHAHIPCRGLSTTYSKNPATR
jgi:hypothetical protein